LPCIRPLEQRLSGIHIDLHIAIVVGMQQPFGQREQVISIQIDGWRLQILNG